MVDVSKVNDAPDTLFGASLMSGILLLCLLNWLFPLTGHLHARKYQLLNLWREGILNLIP